MARYEDLSVTQLRVEQILTQSQAALAAATVTLTAGDGSGTLRLNRAAGVVVTLPAASGSGVKFRFLVTTAVTSNSYKIQVANANDSIIGSVVLGVNETSGVVHGAAANDDTITMDGSTKGGLLGTWLELEDVAANVWSLSGVLVGSGSLASPYTAAVS